MPARRVNLCPNPTCRTYVPKRARFCSRCGIFLKAWDSPILHRACRLPRRAAAPPPPSLNIQLGRDKRLAGLAGYIFIFGSVALLLAKAFTATGSTFSFALFLVSFMVGFMLLMGWLVGRNLLENQ